MRARLSAEERKARSIQSLQRAASGIAMSNYPAIFEGFIAKGIPADEIRPRENVFTYDAWKALGRHVRRGEHGVKVVTWIDGSREVQNADTGETETRAFRFSRTTTVFHESQTEPDVLVKTSAEVN